VLDGDVFVLGPARLTFGRIQQTGQPLSDEDLAGEAPGPETRGRRDNSASSPSQVTENSHGQPVRAGQQEPGRDGAEDDAEGEAGHWSRCRDTKVGAGRTGLALQLGDATTQPQGDALDPDAVAARQDRVRQFVGEDRGEEQCGRDDGGGEICAPASARQDEREPAGRAGTGRTRDREPGSPRTRAR
jgi:hypothetical protein